MNLDRKAAGLSYCLGEEYVYVEWVDKNPDKQVSLEREIYDRHCERRGLDPKFGAAVHCDCGAEVDRLRAISERGCDYQSGRGIFARFQPYTHDRERHYYDPPNFWHKPSNFRVKWYKYIGRDQTTNRDISGEQWVSIVESALESVGAPKLEEAADEFYVESAAREKASQQAMEMMFGGLRVKK